MTCAEANRLIGPWLDDELDVRSVVELEGHVARCTVREERPLRTVRETAAPRRRPARRWLREVAMVAAAAGVAVAATSSLQRSTDPGGEIVDAHLRSLQAGHLTDVASSDQHTVKPWFQGKIDFGVPVRDFAAEGLRSISSRGYRVSSWAQGGLEYRLVTDIAAAEADQLVALLRAA